MKSFLTFFDPKEHGYWRFKDDAVASRRAKDKGRDMARPPRECSGKQDAMQQSSWITSRRGDVCVAVPDEGSRKGSAKQGRMAGGLYDAERLLTDLASWTSLGWMVTRLAWMAAKLLEGGSERRGRSR